MNINPLQRVRAGALCLGAILIIAIFGYRVFFGYDWVGSIWLTVVTLSSVGYSETPSGSSAYQLFTVFVIVLGMTAVGYTFGGMVQLMTQGEIERALGHKRMSKEIGRMRNHVIICGYGRMGEVLCRDLLQARTPFVVVEYDAEKCELLKEHNLNFIHGDASEESVLSAACVQHASTVVACSSSDAVNVFVTLTCRNINPNLQIIARAEHASTEPKLRQAGADRTVMPAVVGGHQVANMIDDNGPLGIETAMGRNRPDTIESEELLLPNDSPWLGRSVGDTPLGSEHVMVVAIRQASQEIFFNPSSNHVLEKGDVVVAMGTRRHLDDLGACCATTTSDQSSAEKSEVTLTTSF